MITFTISIIAVLTALFFTAVQDIISLYFDI